MQDTGNRFLHARIQSVLDVNAAIQSELVQISMHRRLRLYGVQLVLRCGQ